MHRNMISVDPYGSNASNSKLNSELHSMMKEDDLGGQLLGKSIDLDKTFKHTFSLSLDLDVSKEFAAANNGGRKPASPPRGASRPQFLRQFEKRFELLRRPALEDDMLNGSLVLPIHCGDQNLANHGSQQINQHQAVEKPELLLLLDKHSTSSHKLAEDAFNEEELETPRFHHLILQPPTRSHSFPFEQSPTHHSTAVHASGVSNSLMNSLSSPRAIVSFRRLYNVLVTLFSKGSISELDYDLDFFEEEILNCLLQRKYFQHLTVAELAQPITERIQKINEIVNSRSNKRPEECYKFILTRVLKFLKRKYFFSTGEGSANSERQFYEFFFSEVAGALDLPIECFIYPITRKHLDLSKFNAAYFERIFRSERFLAELNSYMEEGLYSEYREELKQKLCSFLRKYETMLKKANSDQAGIQKRMKEYLLKNKRCKLPWSLNEINESVIRFHILLDNVKSKQ